MSTEHLAGVLIGTVLNITNQGKTDIITTLNLSISGHINVFPFL